MVLKDSDESTTTKVARTISLAFSTDPLVAYCRPGAEPWGDLGDRVMAWQKQRVKVAMLSGMVSGLAECNAELEAVAILYPPKSKLRQSWSQALTAWMLQASNWLRPLDGSIDAKVSLSLLPSLLHVHQKSGRYIGIRHDTNLLTANEPGERKA